ncbi:tenascin XB-like protein [Reticulomyxa filosa]|uniref:Tenascin XB-like protein n=1 Tax=Reticulomyxa filosa TaxID=46433 RepID=X6P6E8_RETFI|nr:tenascin XB-like protein [Reticulomyxa filosa]|eukprot:ETO33688.1 tenascin XB-like protein [Reticulomyxa filosa]
MENVQFNNMIIANFLICPRQFDLKKGQSNEVAKFREDEGNCNFKGKMKDLKNHLDKSCNLSPIKQSIPYEIINQLNAMNGQIKELQNVVKDLQLQLKDKDNEKDKQIEQINKQINDLKVESLKKDKTITALTNNIQQYQIQFDEFKKKFETKVENQTINIQQLQLQPQIDTQIEQEQKNEQKEKEKHKDCESMLSFIQSPNLENGVDFLLVTANNHTINLKNNEWDNYKFGIFLLGKNITLIPNCYELGYLKIKTSHLWIKHPSSKIDCSKLGYPANQGPGMGEDEGGGGYGTKGGGNDRQSGEMYGEETLLKQIHFGSGGGGIFLNEGGSGGGIIELIIEQQLINHGSIQANGEDGRSSGGSGGSILIELQCQSHLNELKQTFGTITCIGGSGVYNKGGDGRIAIYGIELSSDDILKINPKPFNRLCK